MHSRSPLRAVAAAGGAALLVGALAPAVVAAPMAEDLTLAAPAEVALGDEVTLDLAAVAAEDLYSYAVEVTYDPALLTYVSATPGLEGGYDAAASQEGVVTVTHTRLGSSPGLAGDLALGSLTFTAVGDGDASLVATTSLVGSDEALAEGPGGELTVAIAAPEPTPTETATETPTDEPTEDPTGEPTATDSADPDPSASSTTGSPVATDGASDSAGGSGSGGLASTGAQVGILAALAAAAVAAGVFLLRRKAVSDR